MIFKPAEKLPQHMKKNGAQALCNSPSCSLVGAVGCRGRAEQARTTVPSPSLPVEGWEHLWVLQALKAPCAQPRGFSSHFATGSTELVHPLREVPPKFFQLSERTLSCAKEAPARQSPGHWQGSARPAGCCGHSWVAEEGSTFQHSPIVG